MDDNKKFWSRFAGVYEKFTRSSKRARKAYNDLEKAIMAELNSSMAVLELAAGPAMLSGAIARVSGSLIVTDFSEEMVRKAEEKGLGSNVTFAVADATNLLYEDRSFDAVVIANALHIMPDPVAALSEIKRVLKVDGILIAPTFTREYTSSKPVERLMEIFGFRTFSKWTYDTYKSFLEEQGLIITYSDIIKGHNYPCSFMLCRQPN